MSAISDHVSQKETPLQLKSKKSIPVCFTTCWLISAIIFHAILMGACDMGNKYITISTRPVLIP
jgi:hypothetical protein